MVELRRYLLWGVLLFFFTIGANNSYAVTLEAEDWKFGINGFLDGEYTYMDEMPMVMSATTLGKMPERSYFDQHHLNLIFSAERGNSRMNINLKSHNAFTSEAEDGEMKGELEFEEVYGVYSFHDLLRIQAGYIEAPFGIYNDIRYITPLFATVVLPQMYLMPPNYLSGDTVKDKSVRDDLMPSHAYLMILGNYLGNNVDVDYYFYISNGRRGSDGIDVNRNKGLGTRLRATVLEDYKFGFSYYTVNNSVNDFGTNSDIGREKLIGFDVEINLFDDLLKIEAEYVNDDYTKRDNRYSYYVRLTGYVNNFSPFIAYDYAKDKANSLYKKGQARYGTGFGYRLSDFVTLKAEYHLHKFNDKDMAPVLTGGTDTISMFRGSMIFVF